MLLNDGTARINPVSGHDAAVACVDALTSDRTDVEVGGPDVYSYDDIARLAFSVVGRPVRIWHVPRALLRAIRPAVDRLAPSQLSGALQFVEATTAIDMIAPAVGLDRLRAFFESIAHR